MRAEKNRERTVFIGLCIAMFFFRGFYGLFNVVLTGYADSLQASLEAISMCAGARSLASTISAVATPFLIRRFNAKRTMLAGLTITLCAVLCMTFVRSIFHVYIGEFLVGFAGCMSYSLPCVAIINSWYQEHQGKLLGIAMGLSSLGGAAFSYAGGLLLKTMSVRQVYCLLGGLALAVCFCAVGGFLRVKPSAGDAAAERALDRRTDMALLRMPRFWFSVLGILCVGGVVVNNLASPLIQSGGISVDAAAQDISLVTLVGAASSYLAGTIKDRLGMSLMIKTILGSYILAITVAMVWLKTGGALLLFGFLLLLVFTSYLSAMFEEQAVLAAGILMALQTIVQVWLLPVSGHLVDVTGSFFATACVWLALLVCAFVMFCAAVHDSNARKPA